LAGEDSNNATDIKIGGDPRFILNMSVWETPEQFEHFVWNTVHRRFYDKKASWFEPMTAPHVVMWWVAIGHVPTVDEALERLGRLKRQGPTQHGFGWESLPNIKLWMSQRCA
jgi:hypothetical protein